MSDAHGKTGSPTKVLRLIARLNVGGPAKHVAWLMRGLDASHFKQTLVAGPVQAGEDDMGPWYDGQSIPYEILTSLGRAIDPIRDIPCLFQVLGLLIKHKPHILATHASKAGFMGRAALLFYRPLARLRGWPVPKAVHTFHGHTFHSYFGPLLERLFLGLERFLARRATWRIVVISPRQLQEIHHTYGVGREEQMALVPLGIDLDPFKDTARGRQVFRSELGAADDEVLIGAVGRVALVKNYPLFIDTALELKNARPDLYQHCRFVLVGGGPDADLDALKSKATELGVAQRFVFTGNRSDPEIFFPGLDALMITSTNEGTPVSILEGGACGLPVVATEVGGVPDLLGEIDGELPGGITKRQRGITAPSKDEKSLAAGVAWIMDNLEDRAGLGGALKEYVYSSHAKERLVKDIGALYEQATVRDEI